MDRRDVKALTSLLGPVLGRVARDTGAAGALTAPWEQAAGSALAQHVRVAQWDGGTLRLTADAPAWAQAVRDGESALIERLRAALPGLTRLLVEVR